MTDTLISGGCGCDGGTIHEIREHTKRAQDLKEYTKGFGKRVSKLGFAVPVDADLKSIKKILPDGRVKGFKADVGAQREALIRIGKAVNKMSGKQLVSVGPISDDKDFKGRAKRVSELIRTTGGALEQDFLNIKNSVSTRSSNIKELIVLTKEILKAYEAPGVDKKEYQTFSNLITLLLTHLNEEANILQKSLNITDKSERDLQKVLNKHKELHADLRKFKINPGSAGTGKMLALMLNDIASITMVAKVIKGYLKQLGLALDEYTKLDPVALEKKVLEKSKKHKGFAETKKLLDIVKYINSYDSKKKDIIKEIKEIEKQGGDVPPSYEKRLKEEEEGRQQVLSTFADHFKGVNKKILSNMDKFAKAIGTDVEVDDALQEFVTMYGQLEDLDKSKNIKAILRYTNDSESESKRDFYLKTIHMIVEQSKKLKAKGNAKEHLSSLIDSLEEFTQMVTEYSKEAQGGFGGQEDLKSTTFLESSTVLNYFVDLGKMKKRLDESATVMTTNLTDFELMIKKSLVAKKEEFDIEKKATLELIKKNPIRNGSEADKKDIKKHLGDYVHWAYDIKGKMWNVAQALEIYLKEFNMAALTKYEDFIKLREILEPIKILTDSSADDIIKLFDPSFAKGGLDGEDYYTYLLRMQRAGTNNTLAVVEERIAEVNKSFNWDDYTDLIQKARGNFGILKNVMALFMGIGDRIGKEKTVLLRKKTSLSVPQMWEHMGEFLFGSIYSMCYTKGGESWLFTMRPEYSANIGKYRPVIYPNSVIGLGYTTLDYTAAHFMADHSMASDIGKDLGLFKAGDIIYFTTSPYGVILEAFPYDKFMIYKDPVATGMGNNAFSILTRAEAGPQSKRPPDAEMEWAINALAITGSPTDDIPVLETMGKLEEWYTNTKDLRLVEAIRLVIDIKHKLDLRLPNIYLLELAKAPAEMPPSHFLGLGTFVNWSEVTDYPVKFSAGTHALRVFDYMSISIVYQLLYMFKAYKHALLNLDDVMSFYNIEPQVPPNNDLGFIHDKVMTWNASGRRDVPVSTDLLSPLKQLVALMRDPIGLKPIKDALEINFDPGAAPIYPYPLLQALLSRKVINGFRSLFDMAIKDQYLTMMYYVINSIVEGYAQLLQADTISAGLAAGVGGQAYADAVSQSEAMEEHVNHINYLSGVLGLDTYDPNAMAITNGKTLAAFLLDTMAHKQLFMTTNIVFASNVLQGRGPFNGKYIQYPGSPANHPWLSPAREELFPGSNGYPNMTDADSGIPFSGCNLPGFPVIPEARSIDVTGTNMVNSIFLYVADGETRTYFYLGKMGAPYDVIGTISNHLTLTSVTVPALGNNNGLGPVVANESRFTFLTRALLASDFAAPGFPAPPNIIVSPAARTIEIEQISKAFEGAFTSHNIISMIMNKARYDKEKDNTSPGEVYELWRSNSKHVLKQSPSNSRDMVELVTFHAEHSLFKSCIKAMFAKVQTAISVFSLFNIPGRVKMFGPERLVIGGGTQRIKTIEEAIPIYIRLPLFIEAYKYIFLNSEDIKSGELHSSDLLITFLPEMSGTIYEGLFNLIWRKMNDEEFYSEADCAKVIAECNRIYTRFEGDNSIHRIINDLVTQVNARYGKMKASEILAFRKFIKAQDVPYDTEDDKTPILPGEGELEFQGAQLIYDMRPRAGTDSDFYKMDKTKSIMYDFMSKLNGFFDRTTKPDYSKGTFRRNIESIISRYKLAKTDTERFDIVVKGIRGVNKNQNDDMTVAIMMHEFVYTPLTVLHYMYLFMNRVLSRLKPMTIQKVWDKVMTLNTTTSGDPEIVSVYSDLIDKAMFTKSVAGTNFPAPLAAKSAANIHGGYLVHRLEQRLCDGDDFLIGPDKTNWNNEAAGIFQWAGFLVRDLDHAGAHDPNIRAHAWINLIDWSSTYGVFLDMAISLNSCGLLKLSKESGYMNLDFSELKGKVESLLENAKRMMDILRKHTSLNIKAAEDINTPGSYFWLKKHLYEGIIMNRYPDKINSLELLRKNIKEGYDILDGSYRYNNTGNVYEKLDTSDLMASRSTLSVRQTRNNWGPGKSDLKVLKALKDSDPSISFSKPMNNVSLLWALDNESPHAHRSLFVNFNDTMEHFIRDTFDDGSIKVYTKLYDNIASGALNQYILEGRGYSNFSRTTQYILPPVRLLSVQNSDQTKHFMTQTVVEALNKLLFTKEKGKVKYTHTEYSSLGDAYKEKLKRNLPLYRELFTSLVTKCDVLLDAVPVTEKEGVMLYDCCYLEKFWSWDINSSTIDAGFTAFGPAVHSLLRYGAVKLTRRETVDQYSSIVDAIFGPESFAGRVPEAGDDIFKFKVMPNGQDEELNDYMAIRHNDGTLDTFITLNNWLVANLSPDVVNHVQLATDTKEAVKMAKNSSNPSYFVYTATRPGGVISSIHPTVTFLELKRTLREKMSRYLEQMLGVKMTDKFKPPGAPVIFPLLRVPPVPLNYRTAVRRPYQREQRDWVETLKSVCHSIVNNISSVQNELDDTPVFGQLYPKFIEDYKSQNIVEPFAPYSIFTWYIANQKQRYCESGSDQAKLAYATRILRGSINLKKADLDYFRSMVNIVNDYETVMKQKIEKKHLEGIMSDMNYLSKYAYYCTFSSAFGGDIKVVNIKTDAGRNQYKFRTKELELSIRNVVNIVESPRIDDQKALLVLRSDQMRASARTDGCLTNIIDLNISPINISALYRQVPFCGLYMYAFTGDISALKILKFNLAQDKWHHYDKTLVKSPASFELVPSMSSDIYTAAQLRADPYRHLAPDGRDAVDVAVFKLLTEDKPLDVTPTGYVAFIDSILSGYIKGAGGPDDDTPLMKKHMKFFYKELVCKLLLNDRDITDLISTVTISNPNVIAFANARAGVNHFINAGSGNLDTTTITSIRGEVAADTNGISIVKESIARFNNQTIQHLIFIELMQEISRQYLVSEMRTANYNQDPTILQSTQILLDYLGITTTTP